jgi:hypothetical protein
MDTGAPTVANSSNLSVKSVARRNTHKNSINTTCTGISTDAGGEGNCFFYSVYEYLKKLNNKSFINDFKNCFGLSDEDTSSKDNFNIKMREIISNKILDGILWNTYKELLDQRTFQNVRLPPTDSLFRRQFAGAKPRKLPL